MDAIGSTKDIPELRVPIELVWNENIDPRWGKVRYEEDWSSKVRCSKKRPINAPSRWLGNIVHAADQLIEVVRFTPVRALRF
jgi:hypothetical protein